MKKSSGGRGLSIGLFRPGIFHGARSSAGALANQHSNRKCENRASIPQALTGFYLSFDTKKYTEAS